MNSDGELNAGSHFPFGESAEYLSEQSMPEFVVHTRDGNPNEFSRGLQEALDRESFATLEQAQAFVDRLTERQNSHSSSDFQGLSPAQMHGLLTAPFDSPDVATINSDFRVSAEVPFIQFYESLLMAVGNGNFKPTATGNLPRNFCRNVALIFWGEKGYAQATRYGGINSEFDFTELNAFRYTCEFAGYLRKYRGKYIIGSQARGLIETQGIAAIYQGLLKAFVEEFNWAFSDGYHELPILQHSWLFTLYLLQKHGGDWKPICFYEDAIIKAFPSVKAEVQPLPYADSETIVRRSYRLRVLQHWMVWFGLAEVESLENDSLLSDNYRIRKRSLADEVVTFHV